MYECLSQGKIFLACEMEVENLFDQYYAIDIKKSSKVIGFAPCKLFSVLPLLNLDE